MTVHTFTPVEVSEVLCHLAGKTNSPSSMGSQLERLQKGETKKRKKHTSRWCADCGRKSKGGTACPVCGASFWAAGTDAAEMHVHALRTMASDLEGSMLKDATAFRVVQDLSRIRNTRLDTVAALLKIVTKSGQSMGVVVVRTLRAFQEALTSPSDEDLERATKRADKTIARKGEPPDAFIARRDEVFQRAIGEYRAPRGVEAIERAFSLKESGEAAELYGDCLLVLSLYVQEFNNRKGA